MPSPAPSALRQPKRRSRRAYVFRIAYDSGRKPATPAITFSASCGHRSHSGRAVGVRVTRTAHLNDAKLTGRYRRAYSLVRFFCCPFISLFATSSVNFGQSMVNAMRIDGFEGSAAHGRSLISLSGATWRPAPRVRPPRASSCLLPSAPAARGRWSAGRFCR